MTEQLSTQAQEGEASAGRMLNLIKSTGSRNQSRNQNYSFTVVIVSLYKGAGEAAAQRYLPYKSVTPISNPLRK